MVDQVAPLALHDGGLHRIEHAFYPEVIGERPTHDAPAPDTDHHGDVEEVQGGRPEGYVARPDLVGGLCREIVIRQIACGKSRSLAPGGQGAFAPLAEADETGLCISRAMRLRQRSWTRDGRFRGRFGLSS